MEVYRLASAQETSPESFFKRSSPLVPHRGVHLDLKGVPPTFERLLSLMDVFKAARFDMVLVEWEDMFPWTCDTRFRSATAYTPEQVKAFLAKAKALNIEVIPLVQCLGHMETPLKFPEYAALREVPEHTSVLNPLAPGARELVQKMVDDVMELLPDIKHFHLGGDEAWTFGTHPDTKAYVAAHGKGALYMHFVEPLLDNLIARGVRPILWHDMMGTWDSESLNHIKEKADLCVWGYQRTPELVAPERHYNIQYIEKFHQHGLTLWGGTAYKGGDGGDLDVPNYARRLENMLGWADIASRFSMDAVFVTAWSRYCTMVTQLSPIDSSLDFLLLSAVILHDGKAPETGLAACVEYLKQIGEYERFSRCRAVIEELSSIKLSAWEQIRVTRQNFACTQLDSTRSDLTAVRNSVVVLEGYVKRITELTPRIMGAFAGLVPDIWMHLYIADRRYALETEVRDIKQHLAEV